MPRFKKISIIIVNYKSRVRLKACVASIFNKFEKEAFEIIIVNNDISENILEDLIEFPDIQVINPQENIGFGRAVNQGAKKAQGQYLMFLNPDTQILTNHRKLLSFFEKNDEAGIISARLVEENGNPQQWSVGAEPSLLGLIGNKLGWSKSRKLWESQEKKEVDWVSGAAMIVKKQLFDSIKGFDENIFMYYEDIDFCKRARAAGKKVVYFPEERVLHLGGRSIENKEKQKSDYYKSQDYYFHKHYGERYAGCIRLLRNIFLQT